MSATKQREKPRNIFGGSRKGNVALRRTAVRYIAYLQLTFSRLPQLETEFRKLLLKEHNWPIPLPHMEDLYSNFFHSTHTLAHNVVCASCGVIGHDPSLYNTLRTDDVSLRALTVPQDTYVPFDFSTGYADLDNNRKSLTH